MIESRFGLRRRPFPATPDDACYYASTTHEAALARLAAGLDDGEGVLLLTAEPGLGKTLVGRTLVERLDGTADVVVVAQTHFRETASLLQAVLYDLGLPHEGRGEQDLRLSLTDHLLTRFAEGRRTILLLDEAHHLSPEQLEELRLLGNLEGRAGKAIQIVLLAQPDIIETLARPRLASLRQRLLVRVTLEPFGPEEAADYLLHHVRAAGGRLELIDAEALELLAANTRGVPRLLSQAAGEAMRLAASAEAPAVDAESALAALEALGLAPAEVAGEEGETEDAECRIFMAPGRRA